MTELETKRDAARPKLAEVRDSSTRPGRMSEKGAQSTWDELDKAFREASRDSELLTCCETLVNNP